ncbi:MAG: hypothetical protein U0586_06025 [Candidatus Brocadiaceae bacterium]
MYEIKGKLTGQNGKSLTVRTIWMTENETGNIKFITIYPDKGIYIMTYKLFEEVVLLKDIPEKKLEKGDVATIVERPPVSIGKKPNKGLLLTSASLRQLKPGVRMAA